VLLAIAQQGMAEFVFSKQKSLMITAKRCHKLAIFYYYFLPDTIKPALK
jgi:hypothetical protein